jgi:hypothetical protein
VRRSRAGFLAALFLVPSLEAQAPNRPRPLVRLDAIAAPNSSLQLGLGAHLPTSTYLRTEVTGALGAARVDGATRLAGRADAMMRFVIDPFGESARAVHALGGISAMYDGEEWRPRVVVGLGLEGRARGRVRWSTEIAVGGGVRLGIVARRTRPNRR